MNVFDVLREKLKEKAEIYRREEEIQKANPCYQIGVYGFKANGYEDAIEIVNQVEQEYNKGWIPCSERLPSKEEYQECNGQFIVSDGNRTYATYFDIYDTLKFGEPTIDHFKVDKCVIAWQPLPPKYEPKGE